MPNRGMAELCLRVCCFSGLFQNFFHIFQVVAGDQDRLDLNQKRRIFITFRPCKAVRHEQDDVAVAFESYFTLHIRAPEG